MKAIYRYTVNFTEIKRKFFRKQSSDLNVQGDHYTQGCYIQVWLYLADRTSHLFYNLASVTLSVCCQKFNKKSATFSLASSTFSTDDNCLLLFCSQHGLVCSISKSIDVAEKSCGKGHLKCTERCDKLGLMNIMLKTASFSYFLWNTYKNIL